MADRANTALMTELAAAFAWWRDAGVDCSFRDEPVNWIAPPAVAAQPAGAPSAAPRAAITPPVPAKPPALDPATLPQDLAAFSSWWLTEPMLDDGRVAGRVPPRGATGAKLMIVVPEPEREDQDRLLGGPQGRLLDAMLGAMGLTQDQVYVASALPRHTPMADWAGLAALGLGDILLHHIALAAPDRLLAFGNNVLPLLGHDLPNTRQISSQLNHGGRSTPLLAATDLGVLLSRPRTKARLWQQWLDWTAA